MITLWEGSSGRSLGCQDALHPSLLANDSAQAAAAASGQLYNQASVTLQANCSSAAAVPATLTEIQSVLSNNLLAVRLPAFCIKPLDEDPRLDGKWNDKSSGR